MLKGHNNQELDNKGIDSKYYLLFKFGRKLTEEENLDSYQYRIMNSLEALRELSSVIGYKLNRYNNTNHNIEECKAETREIICTDPLLEINILIYGDS